MLDEREVRTAAMAYVSEYAVRSGGVVTRAELEAFTFHGESIKLIDQSRGIRNPRQLEATLSILAQRMVHTRTHRSTPVESGMPTAPDPRTPVITESSDALPSSGCR